ncbi:MAG: hypothetical protein PUB43_01575 [Oscillospiraceae bacterium]|nr:hypothetical protein [Oscillospiraceae bacterium]
MALRKEIIQSDGVVTDYHRILYITSTINSHTSIAVLSYVNEAARAAEKDEIRVNPYTKAITFETAYDEGITVESAYEYLKTLPQFSGAVDI